MDKVFDKWCEKLLDTGKGNRLINFKDSKMRTLQVVAPEINVVFEKMSSGDTLSFFDVDEYILKLKDKDIQQNENKEAKNNFEKVGTQQIIDELSGQLKKNQVLAHKKGFSLKKILKNIKKIATTSLVEKGINILYIAFGMMVWKEKPTVPYVFNSPLVLIPISLHNDSQNLPFTMVHYEDEIHTNPTLTYKLKNEHNITLPEFRGVGFEEEGLLEYFERVRQVVSPLGWEIDNNQIQIGTFSFLKINMYKDLKENEEKILANPTIQRLMNKEVLQEPVIEEKKYHEFDVHNVVDADSSQQAAIMQAKTGKSFVLQGPPGTGKSQTITNLIAEFLFDGKKVLFVSEKLSALNVVYNNLRKAGLSDFCLELHSNKTNKKEVIAELYRVLGRNNKYVNAAALQELDELKKAKYQLDNYAETLHTTVAVIDKTPYEIFNEIYQHKNAPAFEYAISDIHQKGNEFLQNAIAEMENFLSFSDTIEYDYHENAWYGCKADSSYQGRLTLKKQLTDSVSYLKKLCENIKTLNEVCGFEIETLSDIEKFKPVLETISKITFFDKNIFKKEELQKLIVAIKTYIENIAKIAQYKQKVREVYKEEIFGIDLETYCNRYTQKYTSFFKRLGGKYKQDRNFIKQFQLDENKKVGYQETTKLLKIAKVASGLETTILQDEKNIFALMAQPKDEARRYNWIEIKNQLIDLYTNYHPECEVFANRSEAEFEIAKTKTQDVLNFLATTVAQKEMLATLQTSFDESVANFNTMKTADLVAKIEKCLVNFDGLENYLRFVEVLQRLASLDLQEFVDKSIENKIPRQTLIETLKLMFYTQWIYNLLENNETLRNFSRYSQDSAVLTFKKKDKLRFEISKAEIISKLTRDMPSLNNMASGSQVSTLTREANKKAKQKPVRLLLRDIGQLVQKLKPCFLMSPLSVSTYLDSDTCDFDVVIFDEASQIFPWDAIGAISRATQVIVVGDSKQMPPSNFFNAGMIEEIEDDEDYEDDALDFESILDLCTAVFNQNRLSWHYRSKTEELIAFSNANFYDNGLTTFPSAKKEGKDMGVSFHFVEGGIFDRKTKTNKKEAERVVDLVFENFQKHPERSVGVVAFSISQQAMIEEIIQARREKDDKFAEFFDDSKPEPFFVKNLETVQGDERDTIIFSIAYAKDESGKFYHNFGPLNKKGGERRLNVAITRAKYAVQLVSSIKTFDIDLGKTESLGAKLLKDYLAYAEQSTNVEMQNITKDAMLYQSAFEKEIEQTIREAGYVVDAKIGSSGYKIDLGVRHPNNADYILAVECDGPAYHNMKTTRDRDRLRQEILERYGWGFYRIWSTNWFLSKESEKTKLLSAIEKALAKYDGKEATSTTTAPAQKPQNTSFVVEEVVERKDLRDMFKEYEEYDIFSKARPTFYNTIYDLVKTEAPITEELLLKKVLCFWGREKITEQVRRSFEMEMRKLDNLIFKVSDYYVVDRKMKIELRVPKANTQPRDILMIPTIELSSGMFIIIKNNLGINKEGLFSTITKLLGFSRMGTNIQAKLEEALQNLILGRVVKEEDGEYFLY